MIRYFNKSNRIATTRISGEHKSREEDRQIQVVGSGKLVHPGLLWVEIEATAVEEDCDLAVLSSAVSHNIWDFSARALATQSVSWHQSHSDV